MDEWLSPGCTVRLQSALKFTILAPAMRRRLRGSWPNQRQLVPHSLYQHRRLSSGGRENLIAGTDCGLDTRVGHGAIALTKFQALAEGARLASQRLWR
jgi:hypothetical protein